MAWLPHLSHMLTNIDAIKSNKIDDRNYAIKIQWKFIKIEEKNNLKCNGD